MPMSQGAIQKMAIIMPFGMFKFLCLPFGLRNAVITFQRMMDQIQGELPFCFVYDEDILMFLPDLIFRPDLDTHMHNLRHLFKLLHLQGLNLSLPMCVFTFPELELLGHQLLSSGCSPFDKQASAV